MTAVIPVIACAAIAIGDGAIWVSHGDVLSAPDPDAVLVDRISPATDRIVATVRIELPGGGSTLAAGGGALWLSGDSGLARVNISG